MLLAQLGRVEREALAGRRREPCSSASTSGAGNCDIPVGVRVAARRAEQRVTVDVDLDTSGTCPEMPVRS